MENFNQNSSEEIQSSMTVEQLNKKLETEFRTVSILRMKMKDGSDILGEITRVDPDGLITYRPPNTEDLADRRKFDIKLLSSIERLGSIS